MILSSCATRVLGAVGCNPWLAVYRFGGVPGISQLQTGKTETQIDIYFSVIVSGDR